MDIWDWAKEFMGVLQGGGMLLAIPCKSQRHQWERCISSVKSPTFQSRPTQPHVWGMMHDSAMIKRVHVWMKWKCSQHAKQGGNRRGKAQRPISRHSFLMKANLQAVKCHTNDKPQIWKSHLTFSIRMCTILSKEGSLILATRKLTEWERCGVGLCPY